MVTEQEVTETTASRTGIAMFEVTLAIIVEARDDHRHIAEMVEFHTVETLARIELLTQMTFVILLKNSCKLKRFVRT
jgi:5S rRNA maturation endonuclease (ribonuclease M5)